MNIVSDLDLKIIKRIPFENIDFVKTSTTYKKENFNKRSIKQLW